MTAKLVWITPEAEHIVSYCARVSAPDNQENRDTEAKLLRYCINNGHWSVFEMAHMNIEITTSRAIVRQILRHRSFSFQEFSQRYAEVNEEMITVRARSQDKKNRQNSIDNVPDHVQDWFLVEQSELWEKAMDAYKMALDAGVAKECARALLPEGLTPSRMYMSGSLRSWITYLQVRLDPSTQLEHREVAEEIKNIIIGHCPVIAEALGWHCD